MSLGCSYTLLHVYMPKDDFTLGFLLHSKATECSYKQNLLNASSLCRWNKENHILKQSAVIYNSREIPGHEYWTTVPHSHSLSISPMWEQEPHSLLIPGWPLAPGWGDWAGKNMACTVHRGWLYPALYFSSHPLLPCIAFPSVWRMCKQMGFEMLSWKDI